MSKKIYSTVMLKAVWKNLSKAYYERKETRGEKINKSFFQSCSDL